MRAVLLVACAGAVLLSFAAPVHGAPSDAAARESRRHFQAAETHFKAGAFDAALAEYQAGYDAKPLPGFLINIAQCQRRLGDLKAARATYQKFVMVAPDSPLVPQAKAMVAELDKLLADLSNAPPNANADATASSATANKDSEDSQKTKPADVEPAAAAPAVTVGRPGGRAARRHVGAGARRVARHPRTRLPHHRGGGGGCGGPSARSSSAAR